jgi:hypothetical protein
MLFNITMSDRVDNQRPPAKEEPDLSAWLQRKGTVRAGERTLSAEKTRGPYQFVISDKDGERTTSDLRQVPNWVITDVFPGLADSDGLNDVKSFGDVYAWMQAVLDAKGFINHHSVLGSGLSVDVKSTEGPVSYVVSDASGEKAYANLDDVPGLDQFMSVMVAAAKRDMEIRQRGEREKELRNSIAEMLGASEALDEKPWWTEHVSAATDPAASMPAASVDKPDLAKSSAGDQPAANRAISSPSSGGGSELESDVNVPAAAQQVSDALAKAIKALTELDAEVVLRARHAELLAAEEATYQARTERAAEVARATESLNEAFDAWMTGKIGEVIAEEANKQERRSLRHERLVTIPVSLLVGIGAIILVHFIFHIG